MLKKSLNNDGFGVCLSKERKTKDMPLLLCHHHAVSPHPYIQYATKLVFAMQQVDVDDR